VPKHSQETANKLIAGLYEAAQDRTMLPSFVSAMAREFQAHIAGLRIHDPGHTPFAYRYAESVGLPAREWEAFDASSAHCNFWRTRGFEDMRAHGVGHDGMIAPRRELVETSFYMDYLQSIDIDYGMGICLWMGPERQAAILSLNRPAAPGAFDSLDLAFAKQLLPHFSSAYAIMRRLSWMESKTASFASAIDRLHHGLILVDVAGRCLYRNEVADNVIAAGGPLSMAAGAALRCADPATQSKLHDALLLAAQDMLSAPARIHVRDRGGLLRYILVVTMVRRDRIASATNEEPCAAIFIHLPSMQVTSPETLLREAFTLTPAEARVAALLANGADTTACAQSLNLSLATVRTHLRNLFTKTGTHRQTELVGALAFVLRSG